MTTPFFSLTTCFSIAHLTHTYPCVADGHFSAKLLKEDKLAAEIAPGLYLGSYGVGPRHLTMLILWWCFGVYRTS